jgi:Flp pilus assembly protein TadD
MKFLTEPGRPGPSRGTPRRTTVEFEGGVRSCGRWHAVYRVPRAGTARLCLAVTSLIGGCGPTPPAATTTKIVRIDTDQTDAATERARTENERGLDLLNRGNLPGARDAFTRAITADPGYGRAHNNLGVVCFRQDDPVGAVREFANAAALMPTAPDPPNGLGEVAESAARFDDAVRCYDQAVALAPADPVPTGNAARARVRRGDRSEELERLLDRVAAADPRPEWVRWAKLELAKLRTPTTVPGNTGG